MKVTMVCAPPRIAAASTCRSSGDDEGHPSIPEPVPLRLGRELVEHGLALCLILALIVEEIDRTNPAMGAHHPNAFRDQVQSSVAQSRSAPWMAQAAGADIALATARTTSTTARAKKVRATIFWRSWRSHACTRSPAVSLCRCRPCRCARLRLLPTAGRCAANVASLSHDDARPARYRARASRRAGPASPTPGEHHRARGAACASRAPCRTGGLAIRSPNAAAGLLRRSACAIPPG